MRKRLAAGTVAAASLLILFGAPAAMAAGGTQVSAGNSAGVNGDVNAATAVDADLVVALGLDADIDLNLDLDLGIHLL
ncbi:hypothetical protein [Streptomyces sp. XD-27]|uniref:hypothetical protein n=1 Tax=Streptomyces sp. XD-27 TaxID=3062779 RepID=UPI0026F43DBE|nr:hypothetical protein [Streptomyces sp. XD-27]WKX71902.1 hypothetical protein Q3Y56_20155 [Streptomyces sp. XD-27]